MSKKLFKPVCGQTYRNKNGMDYLCLESYADEAVFVNTTSRWEFSAHNIRRDEDGRIEWDYSTRGRFLSGTEN